MKSNNPMKEKSARDKMGKTISRIIKDKILNGTFTPCITNTYTHWDAIVNLENGLTKKFRSSWEACFWYCNQNLEYEKLRIEYFDKNNTRKIYITDFLDKDNSIVYEIKPNSQHQNDKIKLEVGIEYCKNNNLKFIIINEQNILEYIQISKLKGQKCLEKLLNGLKIKS
jgi:hypothetical protein